jgi:hypothetical protein
MEQKALLLLATLSLPTAAWAEVPVEAPLEPAPAADVLRIDAPSVDTAGLGPHLSTSQPHLSTGQMVRDFGSPTDLALHRPTKQRYAAGIARAKVGTTMGLAGGGAMVLGFTAISAGCAGQSEGCSTLAWQGLGVLMLGATSTWLGAGVAASGTTMSHRALVNAGLQEPGCGLCLLSWGTWATGWGTPVSYLSSYAQISRRTHRDEPTPSTLRNAGPSAATAPTTTQPCASARW